MAAKKSEKPSKKAAKPATPKTAAASKASTKKAASKKIPPKAAPKVPMEISAEERMEVPAKKEAKPAAKPAVPVARGPYFYANGKRKTSVASVRLYKDGKGKITVNERAFEEYFPVFTDQDKILSPLRMSNALKLFDILVHVFGGGIHSQAEAVRHGISKALLEHDAALRSVLKPVGFLTRDSRVKERKKYGLKRARRAPQWQKR